MTLVLAPTDVDILVDPCPAGEVQVYATGQAVRDLHKAARRTLGSDHQITRDTRQCIENGMPYLNDIRCELALRVGGACTGRLRTQLLTNGLRSQGDVYLRFGSELHDLATTVERGDDEPATDDEA